MSNFEVSLGPTLLFSGTGSGSSSSDDLYGGIIEPNICRELRLLSVKGKDRLYWKDSGDTILENQVVASWKGTKLVRKVGVYPSKPTDGELLVNNTTLNAYAITPFEADNPDGQDYKYRLFPYTNGGVYSLNNSNSFNNGVIYEFIINNNESNPADKIQYCGANEHFIPAHMDYDKDKFDYGSWADTWVMKSFRPCLLQADGTVECYLQPNNLALDIDGNPSQHNVVDHNTEVMVEIDPIYIFEEILPDGNYHICLSNTKVNDNYDCWTHYDKNNNFVKHYYVSKYMSGVYHEKLRSISGQSHTTNKTGTIYRQYAQAMGEGWDLYEGSFIRLMQYLLLLVGKSTDCQKVFGNGIAIGTEQSTLPNTKTGVNDTKGMFYGKNTNNETVTTFFIDNFWGLAAQTIVGRLNDHGEWKVKMTPNTQDGTTATDYSLDSAEGYVSLTIPANRPDITSESETNLHIPSTSPMYIKNMVLIPKYGLFPNPNQTDGSATTGYCDSIWSNSNNVGVVRHGGGAHNTTEVGPFAIAAGGAASGSSWDFGAATCFKLAKNV